MSEFLSKFSGGEFIGLVAVIGGFIVGAISVIAHQWRKVRVAEIEATLKQQMLEKGMTPADIEQVLRASKKSDAAPELTLTGNESTDRGALMARMVEHGYEGGDIERVARAFQVQPGGGLSADKAVVVQRMIENGYEAEDIERVILAIKPDSQWAGVDQAIRKA